MNDENRYELAYKILGDAIISEKKNSPNKPKSKKRGCKCSISGSVSTETLESIERYCSEWGITRSEFVRTAVERLLSDLAQSVETPQQHIGAFSTCHIY